MKRPLTKNILSIMALALLLSVTFLTPAYSYSIPFFSEKSIQPREYSSVEEKIEIYNNQAIEFFEEGRFKEAQELWDKAIQIMERPGSYVAGSEEFSGSAASDGEAFDDIIDMSDTSEIEDLYKAAILAFKDQKYVAAKKMFDRIEIQTPDYKATRNYLTILRHKIKQAQQSLRDDKFKESALSRKAERGEWRRILKDSEKELERKLIEQVTPIYKEALQHYKTRNFKLAKEYFQEIDSIFPKYKDTIKYLSRIDADIQEDEQRFLKEKYKQQALARKKEQEEWRRIIEESEKKLEEKMKEQAEPIYREALDHYKQREFELAKIRFYEVERIVPDFRSTAKYLSRIPADIEAEIERQEQRRVRKFKQESKEREIVQKREEERFERLRKLEEKNRLRQFQQEVAARRKDREEWLLVLKENETNRKNKLIAQADFVYHEAVGYFKRNHFEEAREGFLEAERILPDYKSTVKYLSKIEHEIVREEQQRLVQKERTLERKFREDRYAQRQQDEEDRHFRNVENQKRVKEFKARALTRKKQRDEWDRLLRKNEIEQQKRLKQEAGFVYREALKAYKKQRWEQARNGFLEAQEILPNYRSSEKYLSRIDQDIEDAEFKRRAKIEKESEHQRRKEALIRKEEDDRQRRLLEEDQKKQVAQLHKQSEIVYKFAVSLYRKGDYALAKDKFKDIEDISPGYRSVRKYLARIDADIENVKVVSRQEQEFVARQKMRKQQIAQKRDEEKLRKILESEEKKRRRELKEESLARLRDREEWEKTIEQIEEDNQRRLKQQAESTYQEALRYYKAGWFRQAKEAFKEVESALPGYRSTHKYIARADRRTRKEGRIQQVSEIKIQEFLDREEAVLKIGSVRTNFSTTPEKSRDLVVKKAVEKRQQELSQQAEGKYRKALDLYKASKFIEAKLQFIEVESFLPGYKSTLTYLKRIDKEMSGQEITSSRDHLIEQALLLEEGEFRDQLVEIPRLKQKQRSISVDDRRKELRAQRRMIHQQYDEQFGQLYEKAVKHYRAGAYEDSQKIFLKIERMRPGYKRAASYLKKASAKIDKGFGKQANNAVAHSRNIRSRKDVVGKALDAFEQML